MNEYVSMSRIQYYENGDYVCSHVHRHSHFEWMNEAKECERGVLGWTLVVSWDVVFSSNLTTYQ